MRDLLALLAVLLVMGGSSLWQLQVLGGQHPPTSIQADGEAGAGGG